MGFCHGPSAIGKLTFSSSPGRDKISTSAMAAALSGSGGIGSTSVSGYDRPDVVPGQSITPANQGQSEWFNPAAFCIINSSPTQTAAGGSPLCSTALPNGFSQFGNLGVGALRDAFFYDV